jgi:Fic family protein
MTTAAVPSAYYPDPFTSHSQKIEQIDQLRQAIEAAKATDFPRWNSILLRLRTDWTYHSCGIEGSALTRAETHFFLAEGLTVEGKSFKDYLDARNHAEAIDFFFDIAANKQTITEGRMKEFNTILLQGNTHLMVKTFEGQTVRRPVHPGVFRLDAEHVKPEMEACLSWVNTHIDTLNPVHVAAVACYNLIRIRPFDAGNGRCARFLLNLVLMNRDYFPAVLHVDRKAQYREAIRLAQADPQNPNLEPFVSYIVNTVLSTYQSVVDVLEGRGAQPPGRIRT